MGFLIDLKNKVPPSELRICLVSEHLFSPFDEGRKNLFFSIHKHLRMKAKILTISEMENNTENLEITKIRFNKTLLSNKLRRVIKQYLPHIILYIPCASHTFNSFVRAKTLKFISRLSKVFILGVQHREYSCLQKCLLQFLRPDLLLLLGNSDRDFFEKKGIKVKILPPAIDKERFREVETETKIMLRRKYGIPIDRIIVTHVGHIKLNRNLEYLIDVQKIPAHQVIIVGSSSSANNATDRKLNDRLTHDGIIVINNYLPNIEEIYQLSDLYVFPVKAQDAAIEMPLSVLEAVACNLPVITTRFGALNNYFQEDEFFKFFKTQEELVKLVSALQINHVENRKKIEGYTWDFFVSEITKAYNEIL